MTILFAIVAMLTLLPALMGLFNFILLRPPGKGSGTPRVAILIPARNEEATIRECVEAALASTDVDVEVIVLDDGSTDATAEMVLEIAKNDPRLRLERAPALPAGWKGKTHACHVLSTMTERPFMLFVDCDVRLASDAASRLIPQRAVDFVSGVPRQKIETLAELAVVPMINTLIYFYLPIALMRRRSTDPSLAAACGQLIMVRRSSYLAAGGHAGIANAMHDGMKLAANFRRSGFATDLVDATGIASCRMYSNARDLWLGFGKNATEGMAKPVALPVWTLLLGGGLVAPFVLAPFAWLAPVDWGSRALLTSVVLLCFSRVLQAIKCGEPAFAVLVMPLGVLATLAIQWHALLGYLSGRTVVWRGRVYRPLM
jgi:glycosyltransferase involved in cell wall biosynthesis